jgi:hypothetical protein
MYYKCLLLCIFLSVCLYSSGQLGVQNTLAVTFSPSLLPLANTEIGLQPGLQFRGKRWGIGAAYTFALHKRRDEFADIKYERWAVDLRRYNDTNGAERTYFGLQVMYARRMFSDTNGGRFFIKNPSDGYDYNSAYVNAPVLSAAAVFGLEARISKRFYLDVFSGIGLRRIHTSYSRVENITASAGWFGHVGPLSAFRYNRTITRVHLAAGLRFGFILW